MAARRRLTQASRLMLCETGIESHPHTHLQLAFIHEFRVVSNRPFGKGLAMMWHSDSHGCCTNRVIDDITVTLQWFSLTIMSPEGLGHAYGGNSKRQTRVI